MPPHALIKAYSADFAGIFPGQPRLSGFIEIKILK